LVQKGIDPAERAEEEQRARQAKKADSFFAAFDLFVSSHLSTLRTGKDVEATMRRALLPACDKQSQAAITGDDPKENGWELHDGGAPIAANPLHAYISKFFKWCVKRGKLKVSPVAGMEKPAKERSRDRVLTGPEIAAVWRGCGRMGPFGSLVRFLLVTAARRN